MKLGDMTLRQLAEHCETITDCFLCALGEENCVAIFKEEPAAFLDMEGIKYVAFLNVEMTDEKNL